MPLSTDRIDAITLFVDDVTVAKEFYGRVFDLAVHFEDDESVVFKLGSTVVNLLNATAAPELIAPAAVAPRSTGSRFQLTVAVADVDATCEHLRANGVELLNGPMDRPWGPRTASFQDPDGHIWELAS
ncbi:MAG TPA: VOC family protein [Mycobacteriales bacterium]|nr:VOC family protein [Mycobacteriales bacterium]